MTDRVFETGWLIERPGPLYWGAVEMGTPESPEWSPDSLKAVRFSRRKDAQAFISWRWSPGFSGAAAVQHMWCRLPAVSDDNAVQLRTHGMDGVR